MNAPPRRHWLDDPRHVRWLWRGFLVVLAATVVAEAFVGLHPHFGVDAVFAFNAWYGFAVCALMIVGAKALAWLLKRGDAYYGDADAPVHPPPPDPSPDEDA